MHSQSSPCQLNKSEFSFTPTFQSLECCELHPLYFCASSPATSTAGSWGNLIQEQGGNKQGWGEMVQEIKVEEEHSDGMGWHRGLRTWILFLSAAHSLTVTSSAPLTDICLHPADSRGLLTPLHLKSDWLTFSLHHGALVNLRLNVHYKVFFDPFSV